MKPLFILILSIGAVLTLSACAASTNPPDTRDSTTTRQTPSEVTLTAEASTIKENSVQGSSVKSSEVLATTPTIIPLTAGPPPTVADTDQGDQRKSETKSPVTPAAIPIVESYPIVESSPVKENNVKDNSAKPLEALAAMPTINIHIGNQSFQATLYDNPSSNALLKELPLAVEMRELNGNEKYFTFSKNLPSAAGRVNEIQAGDLMLYGSDYLVLFYESFSTSYSYTLLGRIYEPAGLAEALGNGNISVTIDVKK